MTLLDSERVGLTHMHAFVMCRRSGFVTSVGGLFAIQDSSRTSPSAMEGKYNRREQQYALVLRFARKYRLSTTSGKLHRLVFVRSHQFRLVLGKTNQARKLDSKLRPVLTTRLSLFLY